MSAGIRDAKLLAIKAHQHQTCKDGITPYIKHPLSVALRAKSENGIIVSLLHDVVEDTYVTLDDLRKHDFSNEIVDAIDALTHRKHENYFKYIGRVCENELAKAVKISDILHNLSDQPSIKQIRKYARALTMLTEEYEEEMV